MERLGALAPPNSDWPISSTLIGWKGGPGRSRLGGENVSAGHAIWETLSPDNFVQHLHSDVRPDCSPGPPFQPINALEIDQSELGGASAPKRSQGNADDPDLEKH
ncbi:hypothetical protein M514_11757 [Trichuris suis]|uniref:Uncharacterized protein n=1 Tax=Trichuris suis TaxID=68888 RepID=A0A085MVW9_9BILA|nr:hypothetical protein M513_11757 [Trichuris suis]KFD61365.1 hypothetical protein M514_11757 [Trichuris suis]